MDKILRGLNSFNKANHQSKEKQSMTYEHSSKFTILIPDDKLLQPLWGKKTELNPQ